MKRTFLFATILIFAISTFGQTIKRIDGSIIAVDSLNAKIDYLMKVARVSGAAVSVFNDLDKPLVE